MDHKKMFAASGLIFLTLVLCAGIYAQDELSRLDNSLFVHPQRTGAVFDHDDHNEMAGLEDDCSLCHHVYENQKRIEDESSEDTPCGECHAIKSSAQNRVPLRQAFHTRCKACHFAQKKGPVLCGECHIKQVRKS